MKKIRQELLIELYKNGLKNPLLSPIWILKFESIYHKGSFYLKVYLLENTDISKLNEVQFEIKNENNNCLINVDTFNEAESYKNDSVLGCLIKLPIEFENKSFELLIRRLVIDNKVTQYNETDYGVYRLNEDQTEIKKNKYLSNTLKNYSIFPSHIEDDMWICSCGKVNHGKVCMNCSNHISNIFSYIEIGLSKLAVAELIKNMPLTYSPTKSFDQAYNDYIRNLREVVEFSDQIKDEYLNISVEERKYNSLKIEHDLNTTSFKKRKKQRLLISMFLMLLASIILSVSLFYINYQKSLSVFQDYKELVLENEIVDCSNSISKKNFPELVELEQICYYNLGKKEFQNNNMPEARELLAKSNGYKDAEELMAIALKLYSFNVQSKHYYGFFHDVSFIDSYDDVYEYLLENEIYGISIYHPVFLVQNIGNDVWKTKDGKYYFYIKSGEFVTNLPKNRNSDLKDTSYQTSCIYSIYEKCSNIIYGDLNDDENGYINFAYEILSGDQIRIYVAENELEYDFYRN